MTKLLLIPLVFVSASCGTDSSKNTKTNPDKPTLSSQTQFLKTTRSVHVKQYIINGVAKTAIMYIVDGTPKVKEIKDVKLGERSLSSVESGKISRGVLDQKSIDWLPAEFFTESDKANLKAGIGAPYFLFLDSSDSLSEDDLSPTLNRQADLILTNGQTATDNYCIREMGCQL